MRTIRVPAGGARRELVGGWVGAIIAMLAVGGIVQVSDPDAGTEYMVWYLAPVMFLACASAVWLGLRARRDGEASGVWPAVAGYVIGGFFLLNLLMALVSYLLGFE